MNAESRCADAAPGQAWTLNGPEGERGLQIRVLAHGASWVGCRVPLADGSVREVLLGFDDLASQRANRAFVGAVVGRYANRIAGRQLRRGGQVWPLACAPGANHQLHGGPGGFHQRDWTLLECGPDQLLLGLHSADGDQGYPGALEVQVRYSLRAPLCVEVEFSATLGGDQPCPVGLTQHAYFQLDGAHTALAVDVRRQRLRVAAGQVLPVDESALPSAPPQPVDGTDFDLRRLRSPLRTLDHAYLLDAAAARGEQPAAELWSADGQLGLELSATLPALQVYTGNYLGTDTAACSPAWPDHTGLALEPQYLPDSPHHPEWPQPDCWLAPGATWRQRFVYRFVPGPL